MRAPDGHVGRDGHLRRAGVGADGERAARRRAAAAREDGDGGGAGGVGHVPREGDGGAVGAFGAPEGGAGGTPPGYAPPSTTGIAITIHHHPASSLFRTPSVQLASVKTRETSPIASKAQARHSC